MPSGKGGQDRRRAKDVRRRDLTQEDYSGETYYMRLMRWRRIAIVHNHEAELNDWCRQNRAEMMTGVRHFEKVLGLDPNYPGGGK